MTSADQTNDEQRASGYVFDPPAGAQLADGPALWRAISRHQFCVQFDLKASFYQVSIPETIQRFFGFQTASGRVFTFARLPMGIRVSPELMQLILTAVSPPEDNADVSTLRYVDNVLVAGSFEAVLAWRSRFLERCRAAGITINGEAVNEPHQRGVFCGRGYDFATKSTFIPEKELAALRDIRNGLHGVKCLDDVAAILGHLIWAARIVGLPIPRFFYAVKFFRRVSAKFQANRKEAAILIWPSALPAFNAWLAGLLGSGEVPVDSLLCRPPSVHVFTDATLTGFGGVAIDESGAISVVGERWTERDLKGFPHINQLELRAIHRVLCSFSALVLDKDVQLYVDNAAALSTVDKGASRSYWLSREMSYWALPRMSSLSAAYIPSHANPADEPSRGLPVCLSKSAAGTRLAGVSNCRQAVKWSLNLL